MKRPREVDMPKIIAQKYALEAQNEPVHIFSCGGDGILHEIVNGIGDTPNVYLSILPMGTGNDFVKSFPQYTLEDFLDLRNYQDQSNIRLIV